MEQNEISTEEQEGGHGRNGVADSKVTKRERASWQQRLVLEKIFQTTQYPDLNLRTQLSNQLGMSIRKVQIWFQNRRTKAKNSQMKTSTPEISTITENDSDINLQNTNGNTLLIMAASGGHPSVSKLLASGAKVNLANNKGQTPLWVAVKNGHEATVEILLEKQYNCNVNMREIDHGQSPLHIAAFLGLEKISFLLLSRSENVQINLRDHTNYTPLHHACIQGHIGIVKQLIQFKVEVNVMSAEGYTPLHAASLMGHLPIVDLLLSAGANMNFRDNLGYNALTFAIRESKRDMVEYLISKGASCNTTTMDGHSPIHIACCRKDKRILEVLIQHGANLLSQTNHGWTCLHFAAVHGNLDFIRFFYNQCGIQDTVKDKEGRSARDRAVEYNRQEVVNFFDLQKRKQDKEEEER